MYAVSSTHKKKTTCCSQSKLVSSHSQVALSDLKTNPKISSLLAYFVNFVASGVRGSNFYQFNILQLVRNLLFCKQFCDSDYLE